MIRELKYALASVLFTPYLVYDTVVALASCFCDDIHYDITRAQDVLYNFECLTGAEKRPVL
jgi:hypothetical protein